MEMTFSQLVDLVSGQADEAPLTVITGVAPFEQAQSSDITFAGSPVFLKRLHETEAGAILAPLNVTEKDPRLIRVQHPQIAFSHVVRLFHPERSPWTGISPAAHIGHNVQIGSDVSVAPFAVVQNNVRLGNRVILHPHVVIGDNVHIGDDVEIFPNVTILNGARIGNRVIIHAGTVIGGDGFGFTPDEKGVFHKIPHLGIVQIDDDVNIGANNTIDRATYGKTWIQKGVKTDCLVHVAHNVTVGAHTILVAQVGIAGSTTIGSHAVLAGQVGVSGHITIGDHVTIGPQSGIAGSIPDGSVVSGSPEMPHRQWLRVQRIIPRLPEIKKKLGELEKRLLDIEKFFNKKDS